ncbi:MAG: RNA polymerase subunit sigma [Candidatus Coatesbacteria bacterium]|nr:RNA polymerase subunit sigma [Candidatus Coatesbacteria bacterium]
MIDYWRDTERIVDNFKRKPGLVLVLTGAGISSESGIPTYRGSDGYWNKESDNFLPMEIATYSMFSRKPWFVWEWYLSRRVQCLNTEPNKGHFAIANMEKMEDFFLITQNIDNLHKKAGISDNKIFEIHGNLNFARCYKECSSEVYEVDECFNYHVKGMDLSENEKRKLSCPKCGSMLRPNILWFDECYDEVHFHFYSSTELALKARLLISVGTTGQTSLPIQILERVLINKGLIIDINPDDNPFRSSAQKTGNAFLPYKSGEVLPRLSEMLMK